ncbi:hypothetical protein PsorP6_011492 [Peronosclerospora sorghi]|uniref:Uncharacterized protein n=1 Tax=Peronosclerospora sorghi TaxID=230839 RepID=A0ACC0WMS2_9STRA|nr:hypothetical protein PsorP6_011492 [Peronosclerospora sorghi]
MTSTGPSIRPSRLQPFSTFSPAIPGIQSDQSTALPVPSESVVNLQTTLPRRAYLNFYHPYSIPEDHDYDDDIADDDDDD